jgi:hypothetical protein
MKRTKEWWGRLTKEERSRLTYLEKCEKQLGCRSDYLPDGCVECPLCSGPSTGGLCMTCSTELIALHIIANDEVIK